MEYCNTMAKSMLLVLLATVTSLNFVNAQEMTSQTRDLCSSICQCSNRHIECRNAHLSFIPLVTLTVTSLDFGNNSITSLTNSSLAQRGLSNLERLHLDRNELTHLESGALTSLRKLRVLNLSHNRLNTLPSFLFATNRRLQVLDVSHNQFFHLPDETLRPLAALHLLNASHNLLTSAQLGHGFRSTAQLQVLDLSYNNIAELRANDLQAALSWREEGPHTLNLSHCGLAYIEDGVFDGLHHITALNLASNPLLTSRSLQAAFTSLPATRLDHVVLSNVSLTQLDGLFEDSKFRALRHLDLSRNAMTSLPASALQNLFSLEYLDISDNQLSSIQKLDGLNRLKTLNAQRNYLRDTHFLSDSVQTLRELYLAKNHITLLDSTAFENLWDLEVLDLSNNAIQRVNVRVGFENLKILNLSENRLENATFVSNFPRLNHIDLSHNRITAIYTEFFRRSQAILSINLRANALNFIEQNAFQLPLLESLDLSDNRLDFVVDYGWKRRSSLRYYNVSYNNLSFVSADAFKNMRQLRHLDLSHCNLYSLPPTVFNDLRALEQLTLSHNRFGHFLSSPQAQALLNGASNLLEFDASFCDLSAFPQSLLTPCKHTLRTMRLQGNYISNASLAALTDFSQLQRLRLDRNQLTSIRGKSLHDVTTLSSLNITGNPLRCSCDLLELCDWLAVTNADVIGYQNNNNDDDVTNLQCSKDKPTSSSTSLFEYCAHATAQCSKNSDSSSEQHLHLILWLSIAAACVLIAVLVLTVLLIKYCRRKRRRRHKQKSMTSASTVVSAPVTRHNVDQIALKGYHYTVVADGKSSNSSSGGSAGSRQNTALLPDACRYLTSEQMYRGDNL